MRNAMSKYKLKPVIVEAFRWNGERPLPAPLEGNWSNDPRTPDDVSMHTSQGRVRVNPGDWIVKTPSGDHYPWGHEEFKLMHEPAIPEAKSTGDSPELQFAICVGEIGPDNEHNIWRDYSHLIQLMARRVSPEDPDNIAGELRHSSEYMLFGHKGGRSFTKYLTKEEAERYMIETFKTGMKKQHISIADNAPLRPL